MMIANRRLTYKILSIIGVVTLCSCKSFSEPELNFDNQSEATVSISNLISRIADDPIKITEPMFICGHVVSDDAASNFHKTFIINENGAGVEIMAGIYDLHNIYPMGQQIIISLEGCTIARHYGVVQIGLEGESYSGFPTAYFDSRIILDQHIYRTDKNITPKPTIRTIDNLTREECGLLVNICDLTLVSAEYSEEWKINPDGEWCGYNIFRDSDGNNIAVYTSEYASYTNAKIPQANVDIIGILQQGTVAGEEMFMLKMRNENDCSIH